MSLALLFHYLLLNVFRMLIHPSSGACDLFDELFHGLYCSGSMCVGVTLWFGWGGVVSVCRLQPAYGYHTTTCRGTAVAQWLRCCATNWKVASSIPAGVTGIFYSFRSHYAPRVDSTSNRNGYQEHFLGVKAAGA